MEKEEVLVNINGVHFYARHYTSYKKDEGVKAMVADGNAKDEKSAGEIFDRLTKAVADADAPKEVKKVK